MNLEPLLMAVQRNKIKPLLRQNEKLKQEQRDAAHNVNLRFNTSFKGRKQGC